MSYLYINGTLINEFLSIVQVEANFIVNLQLILLGRRCASSGSTRHYPQIFIFIFFSSYLYFPVLRINSQPLHYHNIQSTKYSTYLRNFRSDITVVANIELSKLGRLFLSGTLFEEISL